MTVMSENQSVTKRVQSPTEQFWGRRVTATPKRLWAAYLKWRIEHPAFTHLRSIRDAQLQDMGLVRSPSTVALCLGLDLERARTANPF